MIQFNLLKAKHIDMKHIDEASMYITANGGEFYIGKRQIEFYVPEEYSDFVAMKFPFLQAEQYAWEEAANTFWPPNN
jgi:hypothetical protein